VLQRRARCLGPFPLREICFIHFTIPFLRRPPPLFVILPVVLFKLLRPFFSTPLTALLGSTWLFPVWTRTLPQYNLSPDSFLLLARGSFIFSRLIIFCLRLCSFERAWDAPPPRTPFYIIVMEVVVGVARGGCWGGGGGGGRGFGFGVSWGGGGVGGGGCRGGGLLGFSVGWGGGSLGW